MSCVKIHSIAKISQCRKMENNSFKTRKKARMLSLNLSILDNTRISSWNKARKINVYPYKQLIKD